MTMVPASAASAASEALGALLQQGERRAQQREALRRVVLAMLPPSPHGQLMLPEEVAASLVLDVVRQHAAGHGAVAA
jgi:hypothetical protein